MTFEGFSHHTYQFLMQLAFHNEKSYFEAHRDAFERDVKGPFRALEEALRPFILELDGRLRTGPMAISRIYRDTRFSKDKSPLRDHMWIGYKPPKCRTSEFFGMFFAITPVGYEYGMGMYSPMPVVMGKLREKMVAAPAAFLALAKDKALNERFTLSRQSFVRPRFHDENKEIQAWLNVRAFDYLFQSDKIERTMQPALVDEIIEGFSIMAPMYRYVHDLV